MVPEKRLAQEAINLSQALRSQGVHFTLNGESYFPHLSLYMLQLSSDNLNNATQILRKIAHATQVIEVSPVGYHYENEYIDIEYTKTNELSELQKKVIEGLNPIRNGLREKDKERLENATGEEKENILKYGYRSIGNRFNPHLTFTRFTSDQQNSLQILPPEKVFEGQYTQLGLYEMGNNGTCVQEVRKWDL